MWIGLQEWWQRSPGDRKNILGWQQTRSHSHKTHSYWWVINKNALFSFLKKIPHIIKNISFTWLITKAFSQDYLLHSRVKSSFTFYKRFKKNQTNKLYSTLSAISVFSSAPNFSSRLPWSISNARSYWTVIKCISLSLGSFSFQTANKYTWATQIQFKWSQFTRFLLHYRDFKHG